MNDEPRTQPPDGESGQRTVLPVSALNRQVARLLERSFPLVWVVGEVSNLTRAASGHCYFSLKDDRAQVRAVMFRSRARASGSLLRAGQRVEALASVSLYEPRGDFQLNVESLRPAGAGDLHAAFLALRDRLQAEGLFDEARKRPLPSTVRSVGVVTSPQAAALRDVLATLAARAPQLSVILYPSPVQGADAPASLVRALRTASADARADVLLLVRGGGSLEDLWAFNDEGLARAIRAASMPVVVGVGHESDVTIADFAADLRAATPTGAATAVSTDRAALMARVERSAAALGRAFERGLERRMQRLDLAVRGLPTPWGQWQARLDRLERAAVALARAGRHQTLQALRRLEDSARRLRLPSLAAPAMRLAHDRARLQAALRAALARAEARERELSGRLAAISPDAVLARGYAVVTDHEGRAVVGIGQVSVDQTLGVRLADGGFQARVLGPLRRGRDDIDPAAERSAAGPEE